METLIIPDTLTGIARQAHLILHGQSLHDAWVYRCKHYAEGRKHNAEGHKHYAEGDKHWTEGHKHYAEGRKHYAEGRKHNAEGDKHYAEGRKHWVEAAKHNAEANKHWEAAVKAAGLTMEWCDGWRTCTLSNGEVYVYLLDQV